MDNIFIDTSVFRQEYFFQGKRINELLRLCKEGHFQLVMPKIIVNEIVSQYKKMCSSALETHNHMMNNDKLNVLKNSSHSKEILKKFPVLDELVQEFRELLTKELDSAKAIILDYPTGDTSSVFDDYFNNNYPFNGGSKKHEFPDAFSLMQLNEWCTKNDQECLIFSNDDDFIKSGNKNLKPVPNYQEYLDKYLKRIDPIRMQLLTDFYTSNLNAIDAAIKEWLDDELNSDINYYTNSYEIHSIDIKRAEIHEKEYQVVAIDNEIIEIEILVQISIEVDIEVDDEENSIYDSEDKRVIFLGTTIENISEELEIPIKAHFYIVDKEDYDESIEIDEINNGKNLELVADRWIDY